MDMAQYGLTFMCDNPEDLYFFVKALYFDPLVWLFGIMVFAIFVHSWATNWTWTELLRLQNE